MSLLSFCKIWLECGEAQGIKVEKRNDEGSFIHDILDKFVRHLIDEKN